MRAGFCLCPEQVLVMFGTSTPRGMQGFTSTPVHGVPLVGHCLFDPSLQAGGSRKHFNPTLPVWVTQTVLSHTHTAPAHHSAFMAGTAPSSSEPSFGTLHVASGIFPSQIN